MKEPEPMKRLAWATDIHLNFCSRRQLAAFFREVRDAEVDALLVGGDIAEADTLEAHLLALRDHVGVPVYFVLGNHDFYRGSVADVRRRVAVLTAADDRLNWMPGAGVVELSPKVALIGHDGFYDAKLGDPWGSRVQLSDFLLIQELAWLEKSERFARLGEFGREAAVFLQSTLSLALEHYEQVIVLTHVPPFREACWHEGEISADDWLPFFTSKATGDALIEVAGRHPERDVVVLCGHTHGEGEAVILPNLRALTGGAVYGAPSVYAIVIIDDRGFASVMPR
jgi:Icc protein